MSHARSLPSTLRARGARVRSVVFAALALGSACARFGFERLDPSEDGGAGGAAPSDAAAGGRGGEGGDSGDGGVGGEASGGDAGAQAAGSGGVSGEAGHGGAGSGGAGAGAAGSGGASGAAGSGGASGAAGAGPDGGTAGPLPSCSDGTRNGDELGVDCGGSCPVCDCSLGVPERLADPNYPGNDLWSPRLSGDGLTLFFAVTVPGTGEQIAYASRPDRSSPFGLGTALPAPINQGTDGTPHPSLDNSRLYFYSARAGGAGGRDLYMATRGYPDPLVGITVAPLTSLNGPELDHLPWLSPDELTIYFASGSASSSDIYRSTRASLGDDFAPPEPVTELNTASDEAGITVSADGLEAIFVSNRPGGAGARDLYRVTRASPSDPFGTPELLDLNTLDSEIDPAFSPHGDELYFASNRGGGDSAVYRAARSCAR